VPAREVIERLLAEAEDVLARMRPRVTP
jgi:hypothetical protein